MMMICIFVLELFWDICNRERILQGDHSGCGKAFFVDKVQAEVELILGSKVQCLVCIYLPRFSAYFIVKFALQRGEGEKRK